MMTVLACGEGEIGDACDEPGSTDECVDDAVCTNENSDSDDENVCRQLCEEQEDCPDDLNCNGVSGSNLKSCQP
jgi:hypothetical protein